MRHDKEYHAFGQARLTDDQVYAADMARQEQEEAGERLEYQMACDRALKAMADYPEAQGFMLDTLMDQAPVTGCDDHRTAWENSCNELARLLREQSNQQAA